jgi:putative transposase
MWRYQPKTNATNLAVLERLHAHAAVRARFGYRRLHVLLEREGLTVNHML